MRREILISPPTLSQRKREYVPSPQRGEGKGEGEGLRRTLNLNNRIPFAYRLP